MPELVRQKRKLHRVEGRLPAGTYWTSPLGEPVVQALLLPPWLYLCSSRMLTPLLSQRPWLLWFPLPGVLSCWSWRGNSFSSARPQLLSSNRTSFSRLVHNCHYFWRPSNQSLLEIIKHICSHLENNFFHIVKEIRKILSGNNLASTKFHSLTYTSGHISPERDSWACLDFLPRWAGLGCWSTCKQETPGSPGCWSLGLHQVGSPNEGWGLVY